MGTKTSLLIRDTDEFVSKAPLHGAGFKVARFVCCPESLVGLSSDGASLVTLTGEHRAASGQEGRLSFGTHGVEVTRRASPGPLQLVALDNVVIARSPRAAFGKDMRGNAFLDKRERGQRDQADDNYEFSPDGRWLARNACRHFELWDSRELATRLSGENLALMTPERAMMKPFVEDRSNDHTCYGPIAFNSNGNMVAAAGESAIHIWRIDADQHLLSIEVRGPTPYYAGEVVAIALDAINQLTAVVSDNRGHYYVARWKVQNDN
jgi:WD40 repeat protein